MKNRHPEFNDPRSMRAWRFFRLRTELMLSSLAPGARKELLQDLYSHVRDAINQSDNTTGEYERVTSALSDIGDPKEFLTPLIADAVFHSNEGRLGPGPVIRSLSLYASRGVSYFLTTLQIAFASVTGAIITIASVASVIRPGYAGFFRLDDGDIQIRLFGLTNAGEPVLPIWATLIVVLVGVGLIYWAASKMRRVVATIMVESEKT